MSDVCYLIYGWIRIDDIRFKVVLVNYVFKFIQGKDLYMFFY